MSGWTPGPWKVLRHGSNRANVLAHERDEDGTAWECVLSEDQTLANARLIAAAPELYEALVDLADAARNACDASQHQPLISALMEADAAILKAQGETE